MANQPIIIKKIKKSGHGHHGGAWKVAYADFVTAMMAFFLLLWLLNAVSQEQLEGISDYFSPISTTKSTTGGGGLLAGKTVAKKGVFEVDVSPPASSTDPDAEIGNDQDPEFTVSDQVLSSLSTQTDSPEVKQRREEEQFREAEKDLRSTVEAVPELKALSKSLLIDNTPQGLRVQIIDQDGLPMFPKGNAEMYEHTRKMLEMVAKVIIKLPQNVVLAGHTDATKFQDSAGYTNWELSADRANAARRALLGFGVPENRVSRVVGRAATDPLLPHDPEAPGNRRLALVLLRGTGVTTEPSVKPDQ